MKINRLLNAARIFNTLIPLMLIALLAALAGWGLLELAFKKSTTVNTVVVPGASSNSTNVTFSLVPSSHLDNGDVVFLKLVARNERQIYEERWSGDVHNLLVVKSGSEEAVWLFPDQSLHLVSTKEWPGKEAPLKALSIQTKMASGDKKQGRFSLYLVRHDGTDLKKVLDDVDEVLGQTSQEDVLRVIYQKGEAVRAARISLVNLQIESDIKLVQITELR
jgi:hypothetical protein